MATKYGGAGALRSQPGGDGIVDRSARSACPAHPGSRRRAGMGVISLNADDLSFLNTLLGEGEVSVRIQHPDGSESEIRETIFCGLWRVRHLHNRRLLTDRLEAGSAP